MRGGRKRRSYSFRIPPNLLMYFGYLQYRIPRIAYTAMRPRYVKVSVFAFQIKKKQTYQLLYWHTT